MTTAYFLGDSYSSNSMTDYPATLSMRMGWTRTVDSQGGTGYTSDNGGTDETFVTRLAALITAAPDVAVIEGGGNDQGTDADWTVAVQGFYTTLVTALPTATVYVTAAHRMTQARFDILRSIVAASGATFVDWGDVAEMPRTGGVRWLTGTGNATTPAGDGNRDTYMSSDNSHPTAAGYTYIGNRMAHAILYPFGSGFVAASGGGAIADANGTPIALGFQP